MHFERSFHFAAIKVMFPFDSDLALPFSVGHPVFVNIQIVCNKYDINSISAAVDYKQ